MQSRVASLFQTPPPSISSKKKRRQKKQGTVKGGQIPIQHKNPMNLIHHKKRRKQHIPIALREQVWIKQMGKVFHGKCPTTWCQNTITVFDFQSGHDIPESKGGPTTLENLIPLCSRCNNSMGNHFTFKEWCALSPEAAAKHTVEVVNSQWSWCCF